MNGNDYIFYHKGMNIKLSGEGWSTNFLLIVQISSENSSI